MNSSQSRNPWCQHMVRDRKNNSKGNLTVTMSNGTSDAFIKKIWFTLTGMQMMDVENRYPTQGRCGRICISEYDFRE